MPSSSRTSRLRAISTLSPKSICPPTAVSHFPVGCLSSGRFLQVQVSFGIEDVQMDDRMKQFAAAVAFPAGGGSGDISLFIDDGEHFLVIIA